MRDFFKGWKQKAGVVALGLACVIAAGWIRSQNPHDPKDRVRWGDTSPIKREIAFTRDGIRFLQMTEDTEGLKMVVVPYLWIILPLTMLSAYLLFSKPRQTALKQSAEPSPITGE